MDRPWTEAFSARLNAGERLVADGATATTRPSSTPVRTPSNPAFDPSDVAAGRTLHRGRSVAADDPVPPTSVNAVEGIGAHGRRDPLDGRRRERCFIGIAQRDADEATVCEDGYGAAGGYSQATISP